MGIGTSQFLKSRLNHYFKFNSKVESRILTERAQSYSDLIISTINLDDLNKPYIKVTPYLTKIDIQKIEYEKNRIIEAKIKVEDNFSEKGKYEPMLKELLTEKTVDTNISVNNWEEAIRYGGSLLEKTGSIDSNYTNKMINAVKNYGPYIVIAPGIALAHASSKDGVNEIGMSLVTLNKGIPFGNTENDPVKIVVCLAAIDHHTHLKALSELVALLDDEEFVEMLLSSKEDEIINNIKSVSGERGE